MLEQLIIIVHVLIAIAIIALILLQQGKGANMGASFGGGGSQTLFGPSGGGNMLTRLTAILATLFFISSFGLAVIAKSKVGVVTEESLIVDDAAISEAALQDAGAGDISFDGVQLPEDLGGDLDDLPLPEGGVDNLIDSIPE